MKVQNNGLMSSRSPTITATGSPTGTHSEHCEEELEAAMHLE